MKQVTTFILLFGFIAFGFTSDNKPAPMPSVQIKDLSGNTVNSGDIGKTGQIIIVSFWATWCGPCIKELDNINDIYEDWQKDYGLKLIAVSIDDSRNILKVKPMVDAKGWPYEILLDENKELARALNVGNPPMTFLINQEGNIVYTHNGYTEGSEFELEKEIKKLIQQ